MTDVTTTESTETNNDAVLEQNEPIQTEQINEYSAAAMAAELKEFDAEQELDFDPMSAIGAMPEEMQQAALTQVKDAVISDEGAEATAADAMDMLESLLQDHGHERFSIADGKKKQGAKRLKPIIQKYAPAALDMFGSYKDEIMAAMFFGSFSFNATKQIKALKMADAQANAEAEPVEEAAHAAN
ncbi:hypothetical protein [Pseudoalteromonas maricaloris]|uniref:hypothetical protein n=1 Tax=Pseudoalteromonas maricaloris TaxID=184924 RepID=UPI003C29DFD5